MTSKKPKHRGKTHSTAPSGVKPKGGNGAYWLYGRHAVEAALRNPRRKILTLWTTKTPDKPLISLAEQHKLPFQTVDARQIEQVTPPGAPHQGLAAQVLPLEGLNIYDLNSPTRLIMLDQITDPHNIGAILRSAAAFGADAVIAPKDNSPPETATLAKSASGALEIVPYVRVTNLAATLEDLKEEGFWVLGMDGHATTTLEATPHYEKTVLVMGAEGAGMRRLTRELCDVLVRLPISDKIESLNVSNACAIALYALARKQP